MYLGSCLPSRVLGMNLRHSSYSKFFFDVFVPSFLTEVSVLAASEVGFSIVGVFASSAPEGV